MTPREVYHLARRASVTPHGALVPSRSGHVLPRRRSTVTKANIIADAKAKGGVPRGCGPLLDRMAAALAAVRQAAAQDAPHPSLVERGRAHFAQRICAEAARRGLETELDLARNGLLPVLWRDETHVDGYRVALLYRSGWAEYSRRVRSAEKSLALLGGRDDSGWWAVRVPGTCTTVAQALEWLMPADVRRARDAGRRVLRQGDVWIVERTRDAMSGARLPWRHEWDGDARVLRHHGHAPVAVPFPAIAVPQRTLKARGAGRRGGD